MRYLIAAAALIAALPAAAADLATTFAARPGALRAALAPDGDSMIYIASFQSGGRAVMFADLKSGKATQVFSTPNATVVPYRCDFKTATRLICLVYGIREAGRYTANFTRVIAIDIDGRNLKLLGQRDVQGASRVIFDGGGVIDWLPDDPGHVLMQVDIADSETGDSNIRAAREGIGAARVDIRTGARTMVERSNLFAYRLGSDGQGNIRFRGSVERDPNGYWRDRISYAVRPKGARDWKPIVDASLSNPAATYFDGFDETGDQIFQLKLLDGRQALYRVATDGSGTAALVLAHPAVDIEGVKRIGKYRRAIGAEYTDDRNRIQYFDPKLAALTRSLGKVLTALPNVSIVDESWDGNKKLVYADGDNVPGRYYLFDSTTKQLGELVATQPLLDDVKLGSVTAIRYSSADGTSIPAYLTLPPGRADAKGLPAIVMPHGGPAARDSGGYDWLAQFFAASGYAVLQPNFRGSSGYGEDFFAKNGFQSWALAISDINAGARWLTAQGADRNKLAIVGWSYGGYAALQANVVEPTLYRATVAIAPVTDLPLMRKAAFEYINYKVIDAMIGSGPHVVAGSPAKQADKITAPVLIFHADKDLNVDIEQSRTMASALRSAGKRVELIEYKGLDHQIDDSEARRDMLTRSAAFLGTALN